MLVSSPRPQAKHWAASLAILLIAAGGAARAASGEGIYYFNGGQDGSYPVGRMVSIGDTLYGTTSAGGGSSNCTEGCGTVFRLVPGSREKVIYAFKGGSDGAGPGGALIDLNGTLYGTTAAGGEYGAGTVFKVTPDGAETVVYSFDNGAYPVAGLINVGGTLYGTTYYGGATGNGTVFKLTTAGVETVLYSFKFGSDGANPNSSLVNVNGVLYGTTQYGGAAGDDLQTPGNGTVFKVTTAGAETVLHAFQGGTTDGVTPQGLTQLGGTLYGVTASGGGSGQNGCVPGCGTVFSLTRAGAERLVYVFKSVRDQSQDPNSLMPVGNALYGTTLAGGKSGCSIGCGTVFEVTTAGTYTPLYYIGETCCGAEPMAPLTYLSGTLYGTTYIGGGGAACSRGCGTVFEVPLPSAAARASIRVR